MGCSHASWHDGFVHFASEGALFVQTVGAQSALHEQAPPVFV